MVAERGVTVRQVVDHLAQGMRRHALQTAPDGDGVGVVAAQRRQAPGLDDRAHAVRVVLERGLELALGRRVFAVGQRALDEFAAILRLRLGPILAADARQVLGHGDGVAPFLFLVVDLQQKTARRFTVFRGLAQVLEQGLSAVKQPGFEVVLRQFKQRQLPQFVVQPGAVRQVAVDLRGALDFAAAAVQIAEREVHLHGLAVHLSRFHEHLQRFVRLLVQ